MSTGTRRTWQKAMEIACKFRELFDGCYDQWQVAGSIRRRMSDVGDAEHVVRPKIGTEVFTTGLFSETRPINFLWRRADDLLSAGKISRHIYGGSGPRWGDKYRGMEFGGMLHEIWSADADNWGNILLIRTGPAEFSQRVVDAFNNGGLYQQDKGYLRVVSTREIVPIADEETYLRLAGIPYIEPEKR